MGRNISISRFFVLMDLLVSIDQVDLCLWESRSTCFWSSLPFPKQTGAFLVPAYDGLGHYDPDGSHPGIQKISQNAHEASVGRPTDAS
jgi:hypothetical protein